MPGLSFLSKKSWHTSNIKNVEKVWIAEQKAEQEKKRLAELQKQLEEERQIQELRQLQAAQGHVVKTLDTTLDWMYQGPASDAQKNNEAEDYLLGKIYKPKDSKTMDLSIPVNLTSKADTTWMNKVSNKNDLFSRVHEDPMMMIKLEEKKQRDEILNNPMIMEKIRQRIAKQLEEHHFDKDMKKKAKKELKKRRKEEKKLKKESKKEKKEKKGKTPREDESSDSEDSKQSASSKSSRESSNGKNSRPTETFQSDKRMEERSMEGRKRVREEDDEDDKHDRKRYDVKDYSPERDKRRTSEGNSSSSRAQDRETRASSRDRRDSSRGDRDRSQDGRRNYPVRDRHSRDRNSRDRERYRDRRDFSRDDGNNRDPRTRSRDRTDRYEQDRDRDRKNNDRGDRDDSRNRGPKREDSRDRRYSHPEANHNYNRDDKRSPKKDENEESKKDREEKEITSLSSAKKPSDYGLKRRNNQDANNVEDKDYLGPRPDLLKKKEDQQKQLIEERNQKLSKKYNPSELTEEEKLRRIAEMERDANVFDQSRSMVKIGGKRDTAGKAGRETEEEEEEKGLISTDGKGAFLQSMRNEVYKEASEKGLKDRLDTNRYYRQSAHEIDGSQNFLKR